MEFFLGFVVTVSAMYFFARLNKKRDAVREPIKIRYGQSYKFDLTKYSYLPAYTRLRALETQSFKHRDSTFTKVMVLENRAYWIQPDGLHSAEIVDGKLDQNSTKRVDTMAMDDVELKQIIYVIDQLNEGKPDDSGSSGDEVL